MSHADLFAHEYLHDGRPVEEALQWYAKDTTNAKFTVLHFHGITGECSDRCRTVQQVLEDQEILVPA